MSHSADPFLLEYFPGAHSLHASTSEIAPFFTPYLPWGHVSQLGRPDCDWYVPLMQSLHSVHSFLSLYFRNTTVIRSPKGQNGNREKWQNGKKEIGQNGNRAKGQNG